MSLALIDYPVKAVGQNLFAGFSPIKIGFKREDIIITDTEIGVNNTVIVNFTFIPVNSIKIGEYIYLYSPPYNLVAEVLEVNVNFLRINTQWIGNTTGGYINYKQNWYAELEIINPENEDDKILPFTLQDDGNKEGVVIIDLSVINDLNALEVPFFDGAPYEMADSRIKFDIRYREVWREDKVNSFTRIENPIIIIPAKTMGVIEEFNNKFDEPQYYKGYNNGAVFLHSDDAPSGDNRVVFYFDEKDRNKQVINPDQYIGQIDALETYGRLFVALKNLVLLENTDYITLKIEGSGIPEYNPLEYSGEYNIY